MVDTETIMSLMALEIRGLADSALETLTIQGHRSQLLRDAETYAMRKCHMSFRKLHGIRMEMILAWLYCRMVIPEIDESFVNIMPMNRMPAVTITQYRYIIHRNHTTSTFHSNLGQCSIPIQGWVNIHVNVCLRPRARLNQMGWARN